MTTRQKWEKWEVYGKTLDVSVHDQRVGLTWQIDYVAGRELIFKFHQDKIEEQVDKEKK